MACFLAVLDVISAEKRRKSSRPLPLYVGYIGEVLVYRGMGILEE